MFRIWLIVVLFLLAGLINANLIGSKPPGEDLANHEEVLAEQKKMDPGLFRVLSFGHLPAAIDWLWIRCLGDFSLKKVPPGVHPSLFYDVDLLTDLDPAFADAYIGGGHLLSVIRGDDRGARDLLLKGLSFVKNELPGYPASFKEEYWKYPWQVSVLLAYVYLFGLEDMPRAAESFREASRFENAPAYTVRLEKKLSAPGGNYEVGLNLLSFMMLGTDDPRILDRLKSKYYNLKIGYYLFQLNRSFEEFQRKQGDQRTRQAQKSKAELWIKYLKKVHPTETDPWGGRIYLSPEGKVASTTEHEKVFGLE